MTTTSSLVNFHSAGHVVVVVAVVVVVIIGGQRSDGWPLGGAALYQCCCDECRRECFSCRNTNYTCNCAACSCYVTSQPEQPELTDAQTLIEKLFRTYSSQTRDRTKPRRQHHQHHHSPSARQRESKVHGRHSNGSHVATVEGQDANRTKKRPRHLSATRETRFTEGIRSRDVQTVLTSETKAERRRQFLGDSNN